MSDVDLKLKANEKGIFDIQWNDEGDFLMTDSIETAVIMSVLCERRAKEYEVAVPTYRRGWIGNLLYSDKGEENGSGVWLYEQNRLNSVTINGVRDEVDKSLVWLVNDRVNEINVKSTPINGKILVSIKAYGVTGEVADIQLTV